MTFDEAIVFISSCHSSPSRYYLVNHGVSGDYYGYPGGPQIMEEYPLYPPGVRPDSICSVSAVGGYDRHWTVEEKRHSLRDRPHHLHGPPMSRDQWGPPYYGGIETSMRRLSIQPRSRSVPRSPSSSSGGPYSPVPPSFVSPARSPSARFDRFPGRMRDDVIYADPSVYSLRRSLSSPKVKRWVCVFTECYSGYKGWPLPQLDNLFYNNRPQLTSSAFSVLKYLPLT